jgi:hypothetical protein
MRVMQYVKLQFFQKKNVKYKTDKPNVADILVLNVGLQYTTVIVIKGRPIIDKSLHDPGNR